MTRRPRARAPRLSIRGLAEGAATGPARPIGAWPSPLATLAAGQVVAALVGTLGDGTCLATGAAALGGALGGPLGDGA